MHIEFYVEELSARAALEAIVPGMLRDRATFRVLNFASKQEMLRKLPSRLRGYTKRINQEEIAILVLVDRDRDDCRDLKRCLEDMASDARLPTKTTVEAGARFHVVNRIVIEELEAWFFGDVEALRAVYPRLPATLGNKARYRDPDAIVGGTWEALHRELKRAGHLGDVFPKLEVARLVAPHMAPERNRSKSFQVFCEGLEAVFA